MSSYFAAPSSPRGIRVAAVVSILLHALLLAIPGRDRIKEQLMSGSEQSPMSVVIVSREPPATAPRAAPPAETAPEPSPAPSPPRKPRAASRPEARDEARKPVPVPRAQPAPAPSPAPTATPEKAPVDMAAVIEARRAQREAAESKALVFAQRRDQGAQSIEPSAAVAIERNLGSLAAGSEGTSGVLQILRKGERTAEFAFNGWRPDAHRRWREVIEVDAGLGGDVELAIVRRMIQLVRGHYSGDFNWQSHKLGRVIVLSARPEDNEALEDFLSREFFGTPVLKRSR